MLRKLVYETYFGGMDLHAEKLELIKLIADVESEKVLKKIKTILKPIPKQNETERILANPAMLKRLLESMQQVKEGKTVKPSLDDI